MMDGHHLKLLKELSKNSTPYQRELSKKLGLSLGKVNYVISALIDRGLIKAKRFKNSNNKMAYMYTLTPTGLIKKTELTGEFLKTKMAEYDSLGTEIEEMKRDLDDL